MRHLTVCALLIASAELISSTAGAKTRKPSPPTTFLAVKSPVLPGAVELSWHKVKGASQYTVSASRETAGNWQELGTTRSTEYQVNELPQGTKYYFRVASNARSGQGHWSDTAIQYSSATKDFRLALLLPQDFHMGAGVGSGEGAAQGRRGELAMQWSPVLGARSYAVQICDAKQCGDTPSELGKYSHFNGDDYFHDLSIVPGTKFLSTGLLSGKSYSFRVVGIDEKGQRGSYSKVLGELAP